MNTVVVIPVRGGSKGIPRKNLQQVGGLSLVARAVKTSLAARVALVCVTTDDREIAAEARKAGALVHQERPETAGDAVLNDIAVLECLAEIDGNWDVIVMVQPTAPLMKSEDIDGCVELVCGGYDTALAACRFNGFLWRQSPLTARGCNHEANTRQRRQKREPEWLEAGSVYAMNAEGFQEHHFRFFGSIGIHPVPASRVLEIDTPADLERARAVRPEDPKPGSLIYVDIDGTVCETPKTDYVRAKPLPERIARFNRMHEAGCTIIYWTARGVVSQLDYEDLTRTQLDRWGCLYDGLRLDKPPFDRLYDDRAEVA